MPIVFQRDPWGWTHPIFNRPMLDDWTWEDWIRPSFNTSIKPIKPLWENSLLEFGRLPLTLFTDLEHGSFDKFEVNLDVHQFSANELEVKLVGNFLVIEGKHEEKQDGHGLINRSFSRKQSLPPDVKPENVVCNLSSDGVLQISAPRIHSKIAAHEKVIPIVYSGQPQPTLLPARSDGKGGSLEPIEENENYA